jgi:protein SCO1
VPPFSLVERSGRTVREADLAGHVWVADFIFTRCPDICPAITARMASLQSKLTDPDIRLVTFYAKRVGATERWWFLTGARDDIARLVHDGFHVAFADDGPPGQEITHSDRLMLVDPALHIRGSYHASAPEELSQLVHDAHGLAAH